MEHGSKLVILLLAYHMFCRTFVMLCLLIRKHTRIVSNTRRVRRRQAASYSMIERVHAQLTNLHRIIEVGDIQCLTNLRMNRSAFARLCYLLTNVGGLSDSRYVRVEEKVAMFLSILAHHKKNRVAGHDYIRSGQTVSPYFHDVLKSLLKLHPLLLVKPSPVDDDCRSETWRCVKGCLGALDGTHVGVHVPCRDKARYRNRKGTIAVNVLGVCDRNMNFIYALTGWEGSAADARVLRDALSRDDSLRVPRGFI